MTLSFHHSCMPRLLVLDNDSLEEKMCLKRTTMTVQLFSIYLFSSFFVSLFTYLLNYLRFHSNLKELFLECCVVDYGVTKRIFYFVKLGESLINWNFFPFLHRVVYRYNAVIMRSRFDENRSVLDMRKAKELLALGEEELFKMQHYQPLKCKWRMKSI